MVYFSLCISSLLLQDGGFMFLGLLFYHTHVNFSVS